MGKRRRKKASDQPAELDERDCGTPELQAKNAGYIVDVQTGSGSKQRAKKIIRQTPIDYYLRTTASITRLQHRAGHRLYQDFYQAGMVPSSMPTTALATPSSRTSGDRNYTSAQMEARDSLRGAMNAIGSPAARIMIENVCCYGFMLKDLTLPYFPTAQTMMPIFKEALDQLAEYYGFSTSSHPRHPN